MNRQLGRLPTSFFQIPNLRFTFLLNVVYLYATIVGDSNEKSPKGFDLTLG